MSTTTCPHCQAANALGAEFCEQCGKALPAVASAGPRVVAGQDLAATDAGQTVQAEQLRKRAGQATVALVAVGLLSLLGGILVYVLLRGDKHAGELALQFLVINVGLAVIYVALGVWARFNPLPAAIVGLVLFVTIIAINAALAPATLASGIIVKVIIIFALAKAIHAGTQFRRLKAQMGQTGAAGAA